MAAPKNNCFNPDGRPKRDIDWNQFEQLCGIKCTQSEIASIMRISPDTLSDRCQDQYGEDYSSAYKRLSESGNCSLRRNQFVLSKKNATMAIFLGKQWLGQRDPEPLQNQDKEIKLTVNYEGNPPQISAETVPVTNHKSTKQGR